MKHVLRAEPFHQPVSDEFVIVGGLKVLGDRLECHQETVEVLITVKLLNLRQGAGFAVALPQFEQSRGIDGSFKMKMQLRLGQGHNERTGLRSHKLIVD